MVGFAPFYEPEYENENQATSIAKTKKDRPIISRLIEDPLLSVLWWLKSALQLLRIPRL